MAKILIIIGVLFILAFAKLIGEVFSDDKD